MPTKQTVLRLLNQAELVYTKGSVQFKDEARLADKAREAYSMSESRVTLTKSELKRSGLSWR